MPHVSHVPRSTTVLVAALCLVAAALFAMPSRALAVGPANDAFSSAQAVSGNSGSISGSNVGATKEAGEPVHAGRGGASVWYTWTAPASGWITVDTSGSEYDTLLAVYTGTSVSALTPVASNDDWDDITSYVSFNVTGGTTYRIAVDGYMGATGPATLNWDLTVAPSNDDFADAQVLTDASGTVSGSNFVATKEAGEPDHAGDAGGASVWYQWTAPSDETIVVTTRNSDVNTLLGVYTGTMVSGLTEIASNYQSPAYRNFSAVEFTPVTGTTYHFAVDGFKSSSSSINLMWGSRPTNDDLASAQTLAGNSGTAEGSLGRASIEPDEPDADYSPRQSVWYSWTAPASGTVRMDSSGSAFDTFLQVYTGATISDLTHVASDGESWDPDSGLSHGVVQFDVVAGTTYRVALDGYSPSADAAVLNWNFKYRTSSTIKVSPSSLKRYAYVTLTGKLGPAAAGKAVRIEILKPGSKTWVLVATKGTTSSGSCASYKYKVTVKGTYHVRARFLGDSGYLASTSTYAHVTVK